MFGIELSPAEAATVTATALGLFATLLRYVVQSADPNLIARLRKEAQDEKDKTIVAQQQELALERTRNSELYKRQEQLFEDLRTMQRKQDDAFSTLRAHHEQELEAERQKRRNLETRFDNQGERMVRIEERQLLMVQYAEQWEAWGDEVATLLRGVNIEPPKRPERRWHDTPVDHERRRAE